MTLLSSFLKTLILISILPIILAACSTLKPQATLYEQLGQQDGIVELTDAFIEEIQYDKKILPYFIETDIDRFRVKFIEQICMISGGPCQYTGDSMAEVHGGMNINEHHFNALVDDLILAMESIQLDTGTQNQLLNLLVPMRKEVIYR